MNCLGLRSLCQRSSTWKAFYQHIPCVNLPHRNGFHNFQSSSLRYTSRLAGLEFEIAQRGSTSSNSIDTHNLSRKRATSSSRPAAGGYQALLSSRRGIIERPHHLHRNYHANGDAQREQPSSVDCCVRIIDYSTDRVAQYAIARSSLDEFLSTNTKPKWANCRWIWVNRPDTDVVKTLGDRMALHPLTLEDVLDSNTPTKVDWYHNHCFIVMTLQKLVKNESPSSTASRELNTKTSQPARASKASPQRLFPRLNFGMSVEQVSIFLTADDTVITLFEHSGTDLLNPLLARLQSPGTLIRTSSDPSMLLQAILDGVVDLSLPIGHAANDTLHKLEEEVFFTPTVSQSTQLYVLRSELTHLMDRMIAVDALVKSLCEHRTTVVTEGGLTTSRSNTPSNAETRGPISVRISPKAQIYLQDVQDHVQALSNSLNMSIRSAENLTSLIFNMIAASQNESMRLLTLVSAFFLPLTFLTGYFGMNFDPMPSVNEHSDAYFWYIATPIMASIALALLLRARWMAVLIRRRKGYSPNKYPPTGR